MPLNIQAPLPWSGQTGQSVQFQNLGGTPQQAMAALGTNYANAYNSALAFNEAMYNNSLGGYQQLLDNQTTAQDAIARGYTGTYDRLMADQQAVSQGYGGALSDLFKTGQGITRGYNDLSSAVLGGIQNIGQERARDIDLGYTTASGDLAQQMVSRGLGNSTVQGAMQRGLAFDRQRSQNALAEQVAGLRAGYQSQLGQAGLAQRQQQLMAENAQRNLGLSYDAQAALQLANQGNLGLGYQQQALNNETNLGLDQLRFMNSVSAPYPQAGLYAQLAQMFGAAQQSQANPLLGQLNQARRDLNAASNVNPALMTPPSYSRGAGGGPPPSSVGPGTGQNFLAGAGTGFTMGLPRPVAGAGATVGQGAGAFGQAWGGGLGTSGQDLASFSSGYPAADYGGGLGYGFDLGGVDSEGAAASFSPGGFGNQYDYGAYFPEDAAPAYDDLDQFAFDYDSWLYGY